jgi:hypothetical protein
MVGFASTIGMMTAFAVIQNRQRIKNAVKILANG